MSLASWFGRLLKPKATTRRQRERATFAGASTNRLTADWLAVLQSADRETRGALRTLRARSRQFCHDNPHVAGLRGAFQDNIIGPDGIGINPKMRAPRGKLLKEMNLAAWEAFTAWGERGICTADGQVSWPEFQRLALGTWFSDGEAIIRRLPGFGNPYGYALQLLDADQLDESFNLAPAPGRNEITQGVEIDRWGRPVAYHLWESHPSDSGKPRNRQRVDAREIIHLYQQLRPSQRRGIPILTPVLIALRMVEGYTQAEVTAAWVAAAQGGFFTMTGQDAELLGAESDEDEEEPIELEAEPGLARKLPPGWKFDPWNPAHPNTNFPDFLKAMLRVIARGCNASYITISGDLSDTSYSSGRQGLITERDAFKTIQSWFGDRVVKPVYRDVLRYANLSGLLYLPTPEPSKWGACQLEPRGWPWVDPKNDAETAEMELASHLNSPQRICAARGLDYEELLDELQEAKQMVESRGLEWPDYGAKKAAAKVAGAPPKPATNGNGNRVAHLLEASP